MNLLSSIRNGYAAIAARADMLEPVALLAARLAVARVFFQSGLTKWTAPFAFNTEKYDLFLYEFFCPEEVRPGALTLCTDRVEGTYSPVVQTAVERFANLAGVMEIVLPVMLVIGFASRAAALGLFAMTLFISVLVFPDLDSWWGSHVWWTVALLLILARGAGSLSLDRLLGLERSRVHKDMNSSDMAEQ